MCVREILCAFVGVMSASSSTSQPSSRKHALAASLSPPVLRDWCAFINQTEARDKFSKVIQYASRFVAWYFRERGNRVVSERFEGLFVGMSQARKLFRLFKTVQEYQKFIDLFNGKSQEDLFDWTLSVIKQLGMMDYWAVENVGTLSKVGFLGFNPASFTKIATGGWFVALVAQLAKDSRALVRTFTSDGEKSQDNRRRQQARKAAVLGILKSCGDLITASNGIELPLRLFGRQFSEGAVGLGGLTSALLTLYGLWPARK